MSALIDLVGQRFHYLTVIKRVGSKDKSALWECKCDCGKTVQYSSRELKFSRLKSCGCYKLAYHTKRLTKHGQTHTKLYNVWGAMLDRCLSDNTKSFSNYKGRGITVCEEWKDFKNFYEWAKDRYENGLTLERINNDLGYCPENCAWKDRKAQARNRRTKHNIVYDNRKISIIELSEILNVNVKALWSFIDRHGLQNALSYYKK